MQERHEAVNTGERIKKGYSIYWQEPLVFTLVTRALRAMAGASPAPGTHACAPGPAAHAGALGGRRSPDTGAWPSSPPAGLPPRVPTRASCHLTPSRGAGRRDAEEELSLPACIYPLISPKGLLFFSYFSALLFSCFYQISSKPENC